MPEDDQRLAAENSESCPEKLARYERALHRLSLGALSIADTAHPFTAIGRIAKRLLGGEELDAILRELRQEGRS